MALRRWIVRSVCLLFLSSLMFPIQSSLGKEEEKKAKSTLPTSSVDIHPLLVGTQAPNVTLENTDGRPFDLKTALSEKPTVLVFYRGWW